jgi:hypothetical protein
MVYLLNRSPKPENMNPVISRFLKRLIMVTLIVILVMSAVFYLFFEEFYSPFFPFVVLFFFFFTLITFAVQAGLVTKEMGKFTRASMMITIGRLLLCILLTALLILTDKENAISVVIVTGFLYLVFTFFEVSELSSYVRNAGNKKSENPDY